jgi:hypothetical protein
MTFIIACLALAMLWINAQYLLKIPHTNSGGQVTTVQPKIMVIPLHKRR